ncbi:MAG: HNH endonuclease [Porphyromonadaceae bacterium]|nr:HNH endonuclease [Porphyromonadaceae bacterium]
MIRVKKSHPEVFNEKVNPQSEMVNDTLLTDQHGKCYLCERVTTTDYEVEHRMARKDYEELKCEWSNLLLACSYCNRKKGNRYNDIINPLLINVEDKLKQEIDFGNKQMVFSIVGNNSSPELCATIRLLEELFNGNNGLRKIREERFFEYALRKLKEFQSVVVNYIKEPSDEHANEVRVLLDIKEEFLGLKYWIIKTNPMLEREFGEDIIWNKVR